MVGPGGGGSKRQTEDREVRARCELAGDGGVDGRKEGEKEV